jgi:hypothetical protein
MFQTITQKTLISFQKMCHNYAFGIKAAKQISKALSAEQKQVMKEPN